MNKKLKTPDPHKPLTAAEMKKMKWKRTHELPNNVQKAIYNSFGYPKLAAHKEQTKIEEC